MPGVINNRRTIANLISWRMIEAVVPSRDAFEAALRSGRKLKFYHGIDPTGPQLHLGHATNLFFLRDMQQLGHEVTLLVGDFTARIGDPTGRDKTRKPLDVEEIKRNMLTYKAQASKLLDFRTKYRQAKLALNSRWLAKLTLDDFIRLGGKFTLQQLLEREMFVRRLKDNRPIALHEFLYPILQGYDSVALDVDAEVGGSDQLFNMLIGRRLLADIKNKEKFVITTKLLVNPKTGKKLMSKSEGNHVALDLSPEDMYGAIMALPDEVIFDCFELCTPLAPKQILAMKKDLGNKKVRPRDLKATLAKTIVSWVHNPASAQKAASEFDRVFVHKKLPTKMQRLIVKKGASYSPLLFLVRYKLASSKSDAKRLIEAGAVELNGRVISDWKKFWRFDKETSIKVGKKRFLQVKVKQ